MMRKIGEKYNFRHYTIPKAPQKEKVGGHKEALVKYEHPLDKCSNI